MFKIAKFEKVNNEKVSIKLVTLERFYPENSKVSSEEYKTLSFNISGDDYSFDFDLNCELEKLLEIPLGETIDFKDYIFSGETWLNGVDEPIMNIQITKCLKNKFEIFLTFYTDCRIDENDYSGMIEFSFNLDDYLGGNSK